MTYARVFLVANGVAMAGIDVDQGETFMLDIAGATLVEVPDIARELRRLYA
jgi:death-on-curing protein